jgi:hypothetical protein
MQQNHGRHPASLTSTCRRHDIDPQLYLTQLLVNLSSARTSGLPAWLPDQWKPQEWLTCKAPAPLLHSHVAHVALTIFSSKMMEAGQKMRERIRDLE